MGRQTVITRASAACAESTKAASNLTPRTWTAILCHAPACPHGKRYSIA